MDYSNYTVFAILKFKIEFLDCLEYSLLNYNVENKTIEDNINYLKKEFEKGMYKEIISKLFTSYDKLNEPISRFFKKYNYDNLIKMIKNQNIKEIIKYNECLIDCYETFKYILKSFLEEKEIICKLNKNIIDLDSISNTHFINFMFFNVYYRYVSSKETLSKSITKKIFKIINYCNKNNEFDSYLPIDDKDTSKIENLSNKCILVEKEQYNTLKKVIDLLNNEIKKN